MKNFIEYITENYENTEEIINRLEKPEVGYMELKESNFRCGECIFISNNYCNNSKIKSFVNTNKGCCNFYLPKKKDEVDSQDWKIRKAVQ